MDDADARLVNALAVNARLPISSLARQLGMARTTVQARMERLERCGVIAGYTVKLGDAVRLGRIRATVLVQFEPRKGPMILQRLKAIPAVEAVHTSSGRFDMILQLATANTANLDEILDGIGAIDGVRSSESLIHLSTKFDRSL